MPDTLKSLSTEGTFGGLSSLGTKRKPISWYMDKNIFFS